jgi:hypothetical protein
MNIEDYFTKKGDTLYVTLWYPRTDDEPNKIDIGLMDVRAADDLLIEYDFGRDGYSIKQASTFEWDDENDPNGLCDPDWQEVAFIQAWAREKHNE